MYVSTNCITNTESVIIINGCTEILTYYKVVCYYLKWQRSMVYDRVYEYHNRLNYENYKTLPMIIMDKVKFLMF